MPLSIKWSRYNKTEILANESDNFGIYELGNDSGDILYIGEGQVRTRLICHFPQGSEPVVGVSCYRVEYTGGKIRCRQRQNAEIDAYVKKNGCYPKFTARKG